MFSLHDHTGESNSSRGFPDSSIKIKDLINRAKELGLQGVAITDHETVGSFVKAKQLEEKLDFPVICGNEIYLVTDNQYDALRYNYQKGMYYPHFILLAKDKIGAFQLIELSTRAWVNNSYKANGLTRTPTKFSDLEEVIGDDKGHIIATSACFTENNDVYTSNGVKKILDIRQGDFVLTHGNRYMPVNYNTSRKYDGYIYEIVAQGMFGKTECTEDHKFLIEKNGSCNWVEAKDLTIGDYMLSSIDTDVLNTKSIDISNSAKINSRKKLKNYQIEITNELLELLGIYTAEGSFLSNGFGIRFTLKADDINIIKKVETAMSEIFGLYPCIKLKEGGTAYDYEYSSIEIYDIFSKWFQSGAVNKDVPNFIKKLPPQQQMFYLRGFYIGDGYYQKRTDKRNPKWEIHRLNVTTVSKNLAYNVVNILKRNLINPNITISKSKIDKNGVNHQEAYYIDLNGDVAKRLKQFLFDNMDCNVEHYKDKNSKIVTINNNVYTRHKIKFIKKDFKNTEVYCMNVEGDNSFTVNNVIAHNCLGGSIPKMILGMRDNPDRIDILSEGIENFITMCQDIFLPENFYFEVQPATEFQQDQIYVNNQIKELSKTYNIPYIIATDAHYLKKELLGVHEKFLNSKETDDREVMDFYRTAYLMSEQEVKEYFLPYWTEEEIQLGIDNTIKIGQSCERYNFKRKQVVPEVAFEDGWDDGLDYNFFPKDKEYIQKTLYSKHYQDRYLMYKIQKGILKLIDIEDYEATFNRIEEELEEFYFISEKIDDVIGNYFITISKIIEIVWDRNGGDSIVGVGRGSGVSSIVDYLLEVTEVNPIKMPVEMPFYRFMSRDRAELPDIDFDTQSNRRAKIFNAVKKYFESLGGDVVNCCTKGEYGSKSAIKTSAKGLGISNDEASVVASLIPVIRGFSLTIDQCYYGDEEKGLQPISEFVKAINKYEGWLDTAKLIEGVYINRGVHASGVFITNTPFTEFGAKMLSPKGIVTSQWDLHDSEEAGLLKYDFLTVSALDKIRLAMDYLIANNHIEKQATLKETYLKYFSTKTLEYDKEEYWQKIHNNEVFDLFQFDSMVAMDAVNKIKPTSLVELMQTNSLMRLQQQEGATETPVETYARFKDNPQAWDEEMDEWQIPSHERKFIKEVLDIYKGVADTQEAMMSLVRNQNLTQFDITDAHFARKVVGKKDEKLLKPLRDKFYSKGRQNKISEATLNYLWEVQIMRQASYAFSILHTLAYTFIALIELVIYSKYPSIYWNCACLSINAEANDESELYDEDDDDDIWADNSDLEADETEEDEEDKSGNTDYGKVASAIAKMQTRGVHITLPEINQSYLSFYPNEKDNLIMYGLKGIIGLNNEAVHDIINGRPYKSLEDFHKKMTLTKREVVDSSGKTKRKSLVPTGKVVTLIKSGAFDTIENKNREQILKDYLLMINPPKTKLIMSNFENIINMGIVPDELSLQVRILRYKKFITDKKYIVEDDPSAKSKFWYSLKRENESISIMTETFFEDNFISHLTENLDYRYEEDGSISILTGTDSCNFDKLIKEKTTELKQWMDSPDCLDRYNDIIFEDDWNKNTGNSSSISKWEMDSVGFYYHDHELKNVDRELYSIVNYFDLSDEPEVIGYNEWKEVKYPKYEIVRICGTVVSRDKTKHVVTLLTPEGAVPVKYQSGQFANYDKQISYLGSDGKKVTLEDGWFKRGNKLLICGYRINGKFKPKKYRDTIWKNTTMLIEDIDNETGKLTIKSERSRVE